MIQYPMERSGAENSIERIVEWKREKISSYEPGAEPKVWRQVLSGMEDHVLRKVEPDDPSTGKILKQ
jgi:hypothetical protein